MTQLLNFISWNPDQTLLHLGFYDVRWYSMCWLIGLFLAYQLVKYLYKREGIKEELFDPLFLYCFVGILAGARLGHCLFYQPEVYLSSWQHFVEMFLPIRFDTQNNIHFEGYLGLASHGGTIGLMIALYLYHRSTKLNLWTVLDIIAVATPITACFIRLGNLMNSEIIGKVTDVPWAFVFEKVDSLPRHPGQLYEAIAYAILFFIIWSIYNRRKTAVGTGFYFGFALTCIFVFRFFIEFTKDIQVEFESDMLLNMGQLLSIPLSIIGIACMVGGSWIQKLGAKPRR